MTYRVDLAEGEVVEITGGEQDLSAVEERAVRGIVSDFAPAAEREDATSDDERRQRLQKRLRVLAEAMNEVEHGGPAHRELKRLYHEAQEKLGELAGGDADRVKSFPGEDFSEESPGGYFGAEDVERIAAEDTGALPEEQQADAELQQALLAQAHADAFGEDDLAGVSDDEMDRAYRRAWGLEEK